MRYIFLSRLPTWQIPHKYLPNSPAFNLQSPFVQDQAWQNLEVEIIQDENKMFESIDSVISEYVTMLCPPPLTAGRTLFVSQHLHHECRRFAWCKIDTIGFLYSRFWILETICFTISEKNEKVEFWKRVFKWVLDIGFEDAKMTRFSRQSIFKNMYFRWKTYH